MRTLPQSPAALSPAGLLDPAGQALPVVPPPGNEADAAVRRWDLHTLAGSLIEISGPKPNGGLTAAARLLREAQQQREPVAWIAAGDSIPHAPDLHDWGIDLRALPLVRVEGVIAGARAAEHLLRSGAFGFVVLDLGGSIQRGGISREHRPRGSSQREGAGRAFVSRPITLPSSAQVRLAALCRRHQAALLILARRAEGAPPVSSMASLRAEGTVRQSGFDRFTLHLQILKDKRQGAGWSHEEVCRGPDGLC